MCKGSSIISQAYREYSFCIPLPSYQKAYYKNANVIVVVWSVVVVSWLSWIYLPTVLILWLVRMSSLKEFDYLQRIVYATQSLPEAAPAMNLSFHHLTDSRYQMLLLLLLKLTHCKSVHVSFTPSLLAYSLYSKNAENTGWTLSKQGSILLSLEHYWIDQHNRYLWASCAAQVVQRDKVTRPGGPGLLMLYLSGLLQWYAESTSYTVCD